MRPVGGHVRQWSEECNRLPTFLSHKCAVCRVGENDYFKGLNPLLNVNPFKELSGGLRTVLPGLGFFSYCKCDIQLAADSPPLHKGSMTGEACSEAGLTCVSVHLWLPVIFRMSVFVLGSLSLS
jgi:hypothetical protein